MIKINVKITSLSGAKYTDTIEVENDFIVSRQNAEFLKLIESTVKESKVDEVDTVKVTANFGEM